MSRTVLILRWSLRAATAPCSYQPRASLNVAFVGRLVPVKRVDLFLETAALLKAAQPGRYRFVVVGSGPLPAADDRTCWAAGPDQRRRFPCVFRSDSPSVLTQIWIVPGSDLGSRGPSDGALWRLLALRSSHRGAFSRWASGGPGGNCGTPAYVSEHTPEGYATARSAAVTRLARSDSRGERHCQLPARFAISTTAQSYADMYRGLLAGQFAQG